MTSNDSLPTAKEILNRFYDAERIYMAAPPSEADSSLLTATLSPDVKLIQSPDLPYGKTFHGVEGFLDWAKQMSELFSGVDVQDPEILEGENKAVVLSTVLFTVRRTGEVLKRPLVQIVKVDRESGVITEMMPVYWDVEGLKKAL
jgi:ketosteroid isomerase-like protein